MAYVPTLKTQYKERIEPALMKEFGYSSVMQCPKLTKIVINQGMGQAVADKKLIDVAEAELTQITGQKAVQTRSRKDISNFKLRKGMPKTDEEAYALLREFGLPFKNAKKNQ